ncbi:MAG TPA: putative toxin-antitoxin system toxin component, PIN family [Candidatus Nanoarchaeia archaeon]|nr:putative toxin-antitoxin system toxin component, PIN family [Candidatus Nanoarchaeia archaeon]
MRAVLDVNILISAVIVRNGNEARILKAAHNNDFKIVTSLEILKEFREVISRHKFGFSENQIIRITLHIIESAEIVQPNIKMGVIKEDPSDNKIIECAVSANADCIVSGDRHLLGIGKIAGIPILRSSGFIDKLNKKSNRR